MNAISGAGYWVLTTVWTGTRARDNLPGVHSRSVVGSVGHGSLEVGPPQSMAAGSVLLPRTLGKLALFLECPLFIFSPIHFMCLFYRLQQAHNFILFFVLF